ncbi:hypothetical protein Y1Q_0012540 [Alligator mississippiensis]|uniref:Uncharacterized protein n=1 Tax=Alligator mississippiensis TaxID=8496 RepID=A0A151M7Z9_ALLMI|nr:hypothetical protein Y1Q_0012540 [Alligator mississippiensis]
MAAPEIGVESCRKLKFWKRLQSRRRVHKSQSARGDKQRHVPGRVKGTLSQPGFEAIPLLCEFELLQAVKDIGPKYLTSWGEHAGPE